MKKRHAKTTCFLYCKGHLPLIVKKNPILDEY